MDAPTPEEKTVAAAVSVLQFELGLVTTSIDSLDRKAALIAPLLVAAAGFLLGPVGTTYNVVQLVLIALAVATALVASYFAYAAMAPDVVRLGPDAEILQQHVSVPLAFFDQRVAEALVEAVRETSKTTLVKGERLTRALKLAGATLFLLVLVRLAGGLPMTDQKESPNPGGPSGPPATATPSQPPPSAPSVTTPAATPPTTPPVGENPLPSFGQQIAAKGGQLPDTQKRIIERGG